MRSLFIPYGVDPDFDDLPPDCRVVGINMSNPPWKDRVPAGVKLITTADVPRSRMEKVTPTVEHAWGLIMAAHRRLVAAASGFGDRNDWMAPYQLSGRNMLIIGYGRIGHGVARVAEAFGMRVTWVETDDGVGFLCRALSWADVIFVSCTLNDSSRGLLRGRLGVVKADAILVSIAPWEIVDTIEVVMQLKAGMLRAAAFDDWPANYLDSAAVQFLRSLGRLTITPHIAGSTEDARAETRDAVCEEMDKWLLENPA